MSDRYSNRGRLAEGNKRFRSTDKFPDPKPHKYRTESGEVLASCSSGRKFRDYDNSGERKDFGKRHRSPSYVGHGNVPYKEEFFEPRNTDYSRSSYTCRSKDTGYSRSDQASRSKHDDQSKSISKSRESSLNRKSDRDINSNPEEKNDNQAASFQNCIDENSSAKNCFDYFTISFISPMTKVLAAKKIGKKCNKEKVIDDWVIHGLWPSAHEGELLQNKCNEVSIKYDEKKLLKEENLVARLRKVWFALYDEEGRNDETFWRYQFNKHGKCATRSEHVKDQLGYFQLGLDLYDYADLKNTLAGGGFVSGAEVEFGTIYYLLKNAYGAHPKIKYHIDRYYGTTKYYLEEIQLCFDHKLKDINHPYGNINYFKIEKVKISYLDDVKCQEDKTIKTAGDKTSDNLAKLS